MDGDGERAWISELQPDRYGETGIPLLPFPHVREDRD